MCIHATYKYDRQHASCEALSAVSSYTDAFVSGFDLDPNKHIRHFSYNMLVVVYIVHVISYRRHAIDRMTSVSRYPEHVLAIDIDVSRNSA